MFFFKFFHEPPISTWPPSPTMTISSSTHLGGAPLLLLLWSFIWNLKWLHLGDDVSLIPGLEEMDRPLKKILGFCDPSHIIFHHANCSNLATYVRDHCNLLTTIQDSPISPRLISLHSTAETSIRYVWAGWVWVHLSTIVRCWNMLKQPAQVYQAST